MDKNLAILARDLEHAIQVIVALRHYAEDRVIEPPDSVFEAADVATDTLIKWRDAIRAKCG